MKNAALALIALASILTSADVPEKEPDAAPSGRGVALQAGDVIVSGFSPNDNSNEWIELFNTTGLPISLAEMEIVTRLDLEPDGMWVPKTSSKPCGQT